MVSVLKAPLRELVQRRERAVQRAYGNDVHVLLEGEIIRMIDVGASGGALPRWHPYRRDLSFVGFEPDERSFLALVSSEQAGEFEAYEIKPIAVWDQEGTVTISFTAKPECSSYFQPNFRFLRRFRSGKPFYGPYDAQELLRGYRDELGIDVVEFQELSLDRAHPCGG